MARVAPVAVMWIVLCFLSGLTSDSVLPPLATWLTTLNERSEKLLLMTLVLGHDIAKIKGLVDMTGIPLETIYMDNHIKKTTTIELQIQQLHLTEVKDVRKFLSLNIPFPFPGESFYEPGQECSNLEINSLTVVAFESYKSLTSPSKKNAAEQQLNYLASRLVNIRSEYKNSKPERIPALLFKFGRETLVNGNPEYALQNKHALFLLYCNEDDPVTYITLVWHPTDPSYTLAKLMAYITRVYYFSAFIYWHASESPQETIYSFLEQLKQVTSGVCGGEDAEEASFVLSYSANEEQWKKLGQGDMIFLRL